MIKLPIDLKSIDLKNIDFKDKKTQSIILIAIVVIAAFVGYLYLIFFPQIGKITTLIGKDFKINSELKSAKSMITNIGAFKKDLAKYNEKVDLYEKKLPAEQDIQNLLENLSSMAKASNIKIVEIIPALSYFKEDAANKSQIYKEIPILITARSGYHELGNFLSDLENADRFMKVVDIGIKANRTNPKMHDVELMVCTYILLEER